MEGGGGAKAGTRTAACLSAIYIFAKPPSSYFFKEIKGDFHLSLSLSLSLLICEENFFSFFSLVVGKRIFPAGKSNTTF